MNTIDITPIVNAAIALIGTGVSVFLIPWLKSQTTEAKGFKVDEESVINAIEAAVKQLNTEGLTIE